MAVKSNNPVAIAVGRLAEAQRVDRGRDPDKIAAARMALVVAKTERCIREALAPSDPDYEPISKEERVRLAQVLIDG